MAHIRKRVGARGTGWQVRYLAADRAERTKTFKRKADAERFAATVEVDIARGEWADPRLGKTLFADWAVEVEKTWVDRRPSTVVRDESVMRSLVLPEFGSKTLASVQPVHVRAWVASLVASGKAAATVRKAYQLVAGVFEQAENSGL